MHKNEAAEEYVDNILTEEQHRIELISEDLKSLKHNINLFLHSIEEVVHEITAYKFNIINIEFNINRDNALNGLYTKISNNKLSTIALKYFINNFSINKKHVLTYISYYFRQNDSDADYIDQFN